MVGIARKKENSAEALREIPCASPPIIEAAERETPGIMATHCAKPIKKACLVDGVLWVGLFLNQSSINNNTTPPATSDKATVNTLSSSLSMMLLNKKPINSAGKQATSNFL